MTSMDEGVQTMTALILVYGGIALFAWLCSSRVGRFIGVCLYLALAMLVILWQDTGKPKADRIPIQW
jgi:hypothetical protein